MLWEFPGGKIEPGESFEEALVRKCIDELNVSVSVGPLFMETVYESPDITVRLSVYNSKIICGEPELLLHSELRWITPDEIPLYNFCQAYKELLRKISETPPLSDRVYAYLQTIPHGKVVTYGQIGAYLGNPKLARAVGNILHVNPDPNTTPCFRVVNSKGRLARNFGFGGIDEQKRRLEADGIEVREDCTVDLDKYRFTDSLKKG